MTKKFAQSASILRKRLTIPPIKKTSPVLNCRYAS
jgi:hypothetical protein